MENLQLRPGKGFYFRLTVPADLREVVGRREVVRSLGEDRDRAVREARRLRVEYDDHFDALRARKSHDLRSAATGTYPEVSNRDSGHPPQPERTLAGARRAFVEARVKERAMGVSRVRSAAVHLDKLEAALGGDRLLATVRKADLLKLRLDLLSSGAAPSYVNAVLATVIAFLRWAEFEAELIEGSAKLTTGLRLARETRESDERQAFTVEQLRLIFDPSRSLHVPYIRRLVPALMLMNGLRPTEAAQLRLDDIVTDPVDGRLVIRVRAGEGQRVKTTASERDVPVHSAVEPLLAEAVAPVRQSRPPAYDTTKGQLFDEAVLGSVRPARTVSDWFAVRLRELGIPASRKLSLYSLRHNFATGLAESDVPEYVIDDLMGHASASLATRRYRKRSKAADLRQYVERVKVPEGIRF